MQQPSGGSTRLAMARPFPPPQQEGACTVHAASTSHHHPALLACTSTEVGTMQWPMLAVILLAAGTEGEGGAVVSKTQL